MDAVGRACPKCRGTSGECPECGARYPLGTVAHCPNPTCKAMSAPIDCTGCGLTVEHGLRGILTLDGALLPFRKRKGE